jgi:hypothetical protein
VELPLLFDVSELAPALVAGLQEPALLAGVAAACVLRALTCGAGLMLALLAAPGQLMGAVEAVVIAADLLLPP